MPQSSVSCFFDFSPVAHEALESTVGQWMAHELTEGLGGHGGRVGAQLDALEHVSWMANGGSEDLRVKVVIGPGVHDFCDEFHTVVAGVVDASDKRRNVGGPCLGGHEGL